MDIPEFDNQPVLFGLVAQGHMQTIEEMLLHGESWDAIATQIGWERCAARMHYEMAVGEESTRQLRSALAEAIEVLRSLKHKHEHTWNGLDCNRAQSAFRAGNALLESRTKYDF